MEQDGQLVETGDQAEARTMPRLSRMFAAAGSGAVDEPGVVCPFCEPSDVSYVHIESTIEYPGNDAYEARGRYEMNVRGNLTAIHFWCEEGSHRWALIFGEHKGSVLVRVGRLPDMPNKPSA